MIVTDGVFTEDGAFWSLFDWDIAAIQEKLRQRILAAFVRWSKLSPEVAESLARWEPERSGLRVESTLRSQSTPSSVRAVKSR